MSTTTQPLKYLFTAHYDDGEYVQNPDDKSIYHEGTEDWSPSAFRDIDHDKLRKFSLTDGVDTVVVDITTGTITHNGNTIYEAKNRRVKKKLIYYRVMQQTMFQGIVGEPYVHKYVVGWETHGKHKEKIEIEIDG